MAGHIHTLYHLHSDWLIMAAVRLVPEVQHCVIPLLRFPTGRGFNSNAQIFKLTCKDIKINVKILPFEDLYLQKKDLS